MFARRAMVIVVTSVALFVGGCNAAATPSSTPKPTAAPTAAGTPRNSAIPESLQGHYAATISKSSVSPGEWPMVVTPNDIMVTNPHPDSEPFFLEMIDITPDRMTFKGSAECTPGAPNREGVYTYTFQGGELKFTVVDDLCADRRTLLTAAAWLRQS